MKRKTQQKISKQSTLKYLIVFFFLFLPFFCNAQEASESIEFIMLSGVNDLKFLFLIFFDIIIFLYGYNTITKQD